MGKRIIALVLVLGVLVAGFVAGVALFQNEEKPTPSEEFSTVESELTELEGFLDFLEGLENDELRDYEIQRR